MRSPIRKKILVVEDDLHHLLVETMRMAAGGAYDIVLARRGDEAVMLASRLEGLALIVMDIQLPGMDGIEATRRIRETEPDVPILALTAWGEGSRGPALAAGATEWMSKTDGVEALIEAARRLMGEKDGG